MEVVEVRGLEIDSIDIPEWAKRIIVFQSEIDDIAESIDSSIQIEPIIVRRLDAGRYELISGYMRIQALRKLGRRIVEAKIIECSDDEALAISLEENLKRTDMHPFDIARKIAYMNEILRLSVREIGRRLNRDASWVVMMLRINSICMEAKKLLAQRIKDYRTLYEVSKLENPEEQVLASKIIARYGLSRMEASNLVREIMENGLEAVKKKYERLREESEALAGEDLNSSKVFDMSNTSEEYKGFLQQPTPRLQASREAREARRCDICGEEKPREDVRFITVCRGKHEAFNELVKTFRKHGFEDAEEALEYVVEDLKTLLSYPRDQLLTTLHHLSEIARMTRGLDLEMLREVVEEVRKRHGEG